MDGFGFGCGGNYWIWILIIILLVCCNGCNILDSVCGLFDNCCWPIILALLFCYCKKDKCRDKCHGGGGGCGGGGFFNCK